MMKQNVLTRRFLLLVGFLCLTMGANAWQDPNSRLYFEWIESESTARVIKAPNDAPYSGEYTIPSTIPSPNDPEITVNVTEIAVQAFKGATALTKVVIEAPITAIPNETFQNSGLTSIVLPATVTTIGSNAFASTKITAITIPENVTSIGGSAFNSCSSLKRATFANAKSLCNIDFDGDKSNPLYYAHKLYWTGNENEVNELVIPSDVATVKQYAFVNCTSLTNVTILEEQEGEVLNGVTTIGINAFASCTSLKSISFPTTINNINENAFLDNNSLKEAHFASRESLFSINIANVWANPLYYASQLFEGDTEVHDLTIPGTYNPIPEYAFYKCTSLYNVTIEEGVEEIYNNAFSSCTNLKSVSIPQTTKHIGLNAFLNDNALQTARFKDLETLFSIDFDNKSANPLSYAHQLFLGENKTAETTITITPACLKNNNTIRAFVLAGATGLEQVNLPKQAEIIESNAFDGCSLAYINYADDDHILDIEYGNRLANPQSIGATVKINGEVRNYITIDKDVKHDAFRDSKWLKRIEFEGNNVRNIGTSAFQGCSNLTMISLPSTIETIGESSFEGCSGMPAQPLQNCDSLISIGKRAFYNCKSNNFSEITFPERDNISLGSQVFGLCNQLKTIQLPKVSIIPDETFIGCSALKTIIIPHGTTVTSVGKKAFSGCERLTEFPQFNGLQTIGEESFSSCTGLTNLIIPEGVTTIDDKAFYGCNKITMASLPTTLNTIGSAAFANCGNLENIYALKTTCPNNTVNDTFGDQSNMTLYVEKGAIGSYQRLSPWNGFKTIIEREQHTFKFYVNDMLLEGNTIVRNCGEPIDLNIIPNPESNLQDNQTWHGWNQEIPQTMQNKDMEFYGYYSTTIEDEQFEYLLDPAEAKMGNGLQKRATLLGKKEGIELTGEISIPNAVNNGNEDQGYTVTTIAANAFKGQNKISKINLPAGVTTIGNEAFSGCSNLTIDELPANLSSIGKQAFAGTKIKNIYLTKNITELGDEVFKGCTSLLTVTFEKGNNNEQGFSQDLSKLLFWNCTNLETVELSGDIANIMDGAFKGCKQLEVIDIPDGIKTIYNNAFEGCTNLSKLTLPATMEGIYSEAFKGCANLSRISIEGTTTTAPSGSSDTFDDVTYAQAYLFVDDPSKYIQSPWNHFNPDHVATQVENEQYEIRYYLGSVADENRMFDNEFFIFAYHENITIPAEKLHKDHWQYTLDGLRDTPVTEKEVNDGLNMEMTANLDIIVKYVQTDNDNTDEQGIKYKVYMLEDANHMRHAEIISYSGDAQSIIIPSTIKSGVEGDEYDYPVTVVQKEVFRGKNDLVQITFGDNIMNIGDQAFAYCSNLKRLEALPTFLEFVGWQAFCNTAITEVTVPAATSMGKEIFRNCTKLKEVNLAEDLTDIPERTFQECNSIEVVHLNNIKTIDDYAFYGCVSIQSLSIPDCVTKIGDHAFWNVFGEGDNIEVQGTFLPTAQQSTFDDTAYDKASLTVSVETEGVVAWGEFHYQEGGSTSSPCEDPVISNDNGKLYVKCPTDNATIVISVTVDDVNGKDRRVDNLPKGQASEITLKKTIKVTAYATKEHMRRSNTVKKTYKFEDVNLDGKINTVDATEILKMLVE